MTNSSDAVTNPYPKLFTASHWRQLLRNHDRDSTNLRPVVKLFTPDAQATWLLFSVSPAEPDLAFGLCDLGMGFPELGYVSLQELAQLRGALGLPVERDHHCSLKEKLGAYADRAAILGRIEV
jgi:hypothetical protein